MKLKDLKKQLSSGSFSSSNLIIFLCDTYDSTYIARQYTDEIARIKNCTVSKHLSLESITAIYNDVFADNNANTINVFVADNTPLTLSQDFENYNNLIIICQQVDKETKKRFEYNIVEVPKLEHWQIQDYVYNSIQGISHRKLDWLLSVCKDNIYRLEEEINKINIFDRAYQEPMFDLMINDDMYSDLSNYDVFNLSNAILSKNFSEISSIYSQRSILDINDIAFLVLMCKTFRNLILVKLNANPTTENTALKDTQIYAIKKSRCDFSPQDIVSKYQKLCNMDILLKNGTLPEPLLLDYILLNMFSESIITSTTTKAEEATI